MKKTVFFLLLIIFAFGNQTFAQNNKWILNWHDEFNDNEIDTRYWSKPYRSKAEWGNTMTENENLYDFEDGNLILKGIYNDILPNDTATYLTGGLWTRNKKSFGNGKIEVRAKFSTASGFWPAIWMLPQADNSVKWPDGGEIDIMEHTEFHDYIMQTVHTYYTKTLKKDKEPLNTHHPKYNEGDFNIYGLEKYPDSLVFLLNGKPTFTYPRYRNGIDLQYPFCDNEFYLILSAQLGASWLPEIKPEELPVSLDIDYVRFYELTTPTDIIPEPKECIFTSHKTHRIKKIKKGSKQFENPEEYSLIAKKGKVTISGNRQWALQSLEQLKDENGRIPDIEIHDWPSYPFRAFMHDMGRNYQSVEMLKETLDLMSFYKLNYFHWHLTDHPAWRIECKAYPQLNDPQYQRQGRDEGKFYTYDEIREIIAYAKERGITVVPEIDMPGHSTYFTNTFGVSMDSEEGKKILETCLQEFFDEIPATSCPYFHIGSDEIHIADPEGFMRWAEDIVARNGRKAIAWAPGLPTSENTIRQIWNEAEGSNAAISEKPGKYVDSFVGYLNYYDPMVFTNRAFLHTAAAQQVPDTTKALGGILCLWNDVNVEEKGNIALHNGMINGMMPYAERFWNGGNAGEIANENLPTGPYTVAGSRLANFEEKMKVHRDRFHKENMRWVANSEIEWQVSIDTNISHTAFGGAVDLDAFCKQYDITTNDTASATAQTIIIADNDMDIQAWIGFDTPARSNRNGYGIGEQGQWEGGSQCFVNGAEIKPATQWQEPGKYNYHYNTWMRPEEEEPYTDEQLYWMREPAQIHLKKGENLIEIRAPKTYNGLRWSFAFIPVTTFSDGTVSEVEGISFKHP